MDKEEQLSLSKFEVYIVFCIFEVCFEIQYYSKVCYQWLWDIRMIFIIY